MYRITSFSGNTIIGQQTCEAQVDVRQVALMVARQWQGIPGVHTYIRRNGVPVGEVNSAELWADIEYRDDDTGWCLDRVYNK